MNWFKRLFRRKPKTPPRITDCPRTEGKRRDCDLCSLKYVCIDPGRDDKRPSQGPDLVGRQGGQARNRVHIYRQPYGYPIRLCDWVAVERQSIELRGEAMGVAGPAETVTLAAALDWRENAGDRICRHCQAIAQGKRESIMGLLPVPGRERGSNARKAESK